MTALIYFLIYTEQKEQSLQKEDHGEKSIRVSLRKKTHIYREFNVFMRDNESETETFEVTASGSTWSNSLNQTITTNNQETVLCNKQKMLDEHQSCNHEEPDYRLLLHACDAAFQKAFRKLSITTVHTEVVVFALYHFFTSFQWAVGQIWYLKLLAL